MFTVRQCDDLVNADRKHLLWTQTSHELYVGVWEPWGSTTQRVDPTHVIHLQGTLKRLIVAV
jgi:hypothetical protein